MRQKKKKEKKKTGVTPDGQGIQDVVNVVSTL